MEWLNEKPFEHRCFNGTVFSGTRCDLRDGVIVDAITTNPFRLCQDYAEFAAWHGMHCISSGG
jgi:hypothetical protein